MASPVKKSKTTEKVDIENSVKENTTNINTVEETPIEDSSTVSNIQGNTITKAPEVSTKAPDPAPTDTTTMLMQTLLDLKKQVETLSQKVADNEAKSQQTEEVMDNTQKDPEPIPQPAPQVAIPVPVPVNNIANSPDTSVKLLEYLTNKKSDKEITLIHNKEMMGGLSTSIRLNGLSIDFHSMGEQRVLSWQQFEECVSKYKSWFNKKIILLSYEDRDLADRYNVPYLGQDGKLTLTREYLAKVGKMTVAQLEDFYNKLCPEDQNNLCSYWVGKCYERVPEYYDRYKVEALNRLSDCGAFDNVLLNMNYDFMKDKNNNKAQPTNQVQKQIPRINAQM